MENVDDVKRRAQQGTTARIEAIKNLARMRAVSDKEKRHTAPVDGKRDGDQESAMPVSRRR